MSKSVQDLTDGQRDAYNESRRISNRETLRRLKAQNEAIKEAHRRRLIVRPDAFGRTEDEIVRTFTRETLYGEQQTARYRGTGFYAGRRS